MWTVAVAGNSKEIVTCATNTNLSYRLCTCGFQKTRKVLLNSLGPGSKHASPQLDLLLCWLHCAHANALQLSRYGIFTHLRLRYTSKYWGGPLEPIGTKVEIAYMVSFEESMEMLHDLKKSDNPDKLLNA